MEITISGIPAKQFIHLPQEKQEELLLYRIEMNKQNGMFFNLKEDLDNLLEYLKTWNDFIVDYNPDCLFPYLDFERFWVRKNDCVYRVYSIDINSPDDIFKIYESLTQNELLKEEYENRQKRGIFYFPNYHSAELFKDLLLVELDELTFLYSLHRQYVEYSDAPLKFVDKLIDGIKFCVKSKREERIIWDMPIIQ